jgi:hypothetical protein
MLSCSSCPCTACAQGHKLRDVPPYADVRAVAVELSAARLPERQRLAALSALPCLAPPGLLAAPAAAAQAGPADGQLLDALHGGPAPTLPTQASAMKLDTWLMPEMGLPSDLRASEPGAAAAAAPSGLGTGTGIAHWLGGAVRRQRTTSELCLT